MKIKKFVGFQIESDGKHYRIRVSPVIQKQGYIDQLMVNKIKTEERRLQDEGLTPEPFGYEMK